MYQKMKRSICNRNAKINYSKHNKYSILSIAYVVSILVDGFAAYLLLEIYVGLTVSMTLSLSNIYFITYILDSLWTKNYNLIIRYMSFKGASDLLIPIVLRLF